MKKSLVQGPISPSFIADSIAKHQSKTEIGAHQIFLGQVRADQIENRTVKAIDFSAHDEMAESIIHEIREEAFAKFDLTCMHIYHSLGNVQVGEICLFVLVSSPHRKASNEAVVFLVEALKARVPIFGKEILSDDTHVWKENTITR
jgi:molybdopterin synthase catalytic subunit